MATSTMPWLSLVVLSFKRFDTTTGPCPRSTNAPCPTAPVRRNAP